MTEKSKPVGLPTRMVLSAIGGMGAATVCHPLDVIRVQMQVFKSNGSIATARLIISEGGGVVGGLYAGVSAAYLRQWTYGSCRVGIYSYLLEKVSDGNTPVPFYMKLMMGCTSGGIGSFVGCPSELALVRMGADGRAAPELRRGYKNVVDCIVRVAKDEGPSALWRGATPTILRACLLSASVLACYSEAKTALSEKFPVIFSADGIHTMFAATMMASLVANTVANPFDVVKSRIQNMPVPAKGNAPLYTGMVDCLRKSIASEGPLVLFRGFTPAFIKLAPYTTISLILTEKLTTALTGKAAL